MTPASPAAREGEWLPLEQYAAIGDGRSVALVGADGSVDWWGVPAMDSVPFFDRLLAGAEGGRLSVTPMDAFTVRRGYRPGSNVLELVFTTAAGSARVTCSLNSGPSGRLPWSELAFRVEGLDGAVAFQVEVRPGNRLGAATPWREPAPGGPDAGEVLHLDGVVAAFRASPALDRVAEDDRHVVAWLQTAPGSRATLALLATADGPLILPPLDAIGARIDRSDQAWAEWSAGLSYNGPYADAVRRSALALKLLLHTPTGAIAAAATTSLPERIGEGKTYDYRFAWVRDVAYTVKAFLRVGAVEEARAAFAWLMATVARHGGRPRTMYALDGSLSPEEEELDLPGYRGSRPVRRGNRARDQLQLGVYGDLLETAALFVRHGHVLDLPARRLLADLADQCADLWQRPDAGIWELEQAEHYTMSKVGCWTALHRAVDLAEAGQVDWAHAGRWARERDRIRDWVDAHCWSDAKQAYTLHPGTDRLDASLLLVVRFGFARPDRLALTRDAVVRELARGPLVHRYSGMEREEGAFLACSFWLVEAYALLGDKQAAARQMGALLAATGGNLGLLGEQMDPATGAMLGNMPQALSHLAMIHAALSLEE